MLLRNNSSDSAESMKLGTRSAQRQDGARGEAAGQGRDRWRVGGEAPGTGRRDAGKEGPAGVRLTWGAGRHKPRKCSVFW